MRIGEFVSTDLIGATVTVSTVLFDITCEDLAHRTDCSVHAVWPDENGQLMFTLRLPGGRLWSVSERHGIELKCWYGK